ncbi:MAG: sodium:alanine symporter family protein [Oscillospiraceae bacterium]|nr:sodium:alanine symporter family protein [Oscillospiraceae bacterium]
MLILSAFTFCNIVTDLNNLLWGIGVFILIALIGIYFTIRIKFCNFIHIVHIFKETFAPTLSCASKKQKGKISHFQALSTALAASMGTGNIIGVAAAISIGGPGAIFWMWVSAIFGSSIGLVENTLGFLFQSKGKGPMGYISTAYKSEQASLAYALLCILASFGIGNLTQANAIASAAESFNIPHHISGVFITILVGFVILRGGKRVASAAEKLVPFAAVLYLAGAILVIVYYGNYISDILILIIKSAFGFNQISGGISGAILKNAITVGLRRGIFSNEAGLGSSVLVHSETSTNSAVKMGMFAVVEVVIDTLICCTATAFVILLTGVDTQNTEGLAIVAQGFRTVMGNFAPIFVSSTTVIFAFCTLIGWYFYGEKCLDYICKTGNSNAVFCYRILYIFSSFAGAVTQLKTVWEIADLLNWFMLVINLTAVIILHNHAVKEINKYTYSIKFNRKRK